MGVFTSGQIVVRAVKLETAMSLQEFRDAAVQESYPRSGDEPSAGWGGPWDDESALNVPSLVPIAIGDPQLVSDELPDRLRLRYYWDEFNRTAFRSAGLDADWARIHFRRALDVVVLKDEQDGRLTALISSRDIRVLKAHPVIAIERLVKAHDPTAKVEFDLIPERFNHDFFMWLLHRLNGDKVLRPGVKLSAIYELSSRDRLLRGARFTDKATMERIELAALITMGQAQFGPAKVGLDVEELDASLDVELHLDGGFKVYRSSDFEEREVPELELGHVFVEEFWAVVHPELREAYEEDETWRTTGKAALRDQAISQIKAILPPD